MEIDVGHEIPRYSDVCTFCEHLLDLGKGRRCKAFKDGIPMEIWMGENKHLTPFPGDGGIQFTKAE